MKVLRGGGEFARKQSNRAFLAFCLILFMACSVIFYLAPGESPGKRGISAGVLLALVLPVLTRPLYRRWVNRQKGIAGEELVKGLLPRLSDQYVLINDVVLPGKRGNIDHVLVGPCGVVVIESKHYSGIISCGGDRWFRNGAPIKSPSVQVKGQAVSLRAYLEKKLGTVGDAVKFVEAVVVFTNPMVRLKLRYPKATVVRFSELLPLVIELGKRNSLSPQLVSRISQCVLIGTS